jgi:hypothetical protein
VPKDLPVPRLVKGELVDIQKSNPEVYPGVPDPVTAFALIGVPKEPVCERCGGTGYDPEDATVDIIGGGPWPAECRVCARDECRYSFDP